MSNFILTSLLNINKRSYLFFILLGGMSFINLSAQHPEDFEPDAAQILPPSADNYQFTRYGNLQLSGNSGAFTYSLPLYQVQYGKLLLSLSLDYFTTGVKVNDIAGPVGLGWNLNAGGMITRVVKDRPDEFSGLTVYHPDREDILHTLSGNYPLSEYLTEHRESLISIWNSTQPITERLIDMEQDWFSFNFNGFSGNFYIDNDQIYISSSVSGLKAYFTKQSAGGSIPTLEFIFITPDGTVYTFGGHEDYIENSEILTNCGKSYERSFPTTWYLKKIKQLGEEINFTYESAAKEYPLYYFEEISLTNDFDNPFNWVPSSRECKNYFKASNGKYLKKIEFGESSLDFSNGFREDYSLGRILNAIEVKHKNNTVKTISMNYAYSLSGNGSVIDSEVVKKRAFLEEVIVNGEQIYEFEYNNPWSLPPRLSPKQDIYGYPNSNNYSHLINLNHPIYQQAGNTTIFQNYFNNYNGANREVDPTKSKLGVLTKIVYPTGGSTEIGYENHITGNIETYTVFNHDAYTVEESDCPNEHPVVWPNEKIIEIEGDGNEMLINAVAFWSGCDNNVSWHDKHFLKIIKQTPGNPDEVLLNSHLDPEYQFIGDGTGSSNSSDIVFSPIITEVGSLYKIYYSVQSEFNFVYGTIHVKYHPHEVQIPTQYNYSGTRVKSIKDIDETGNYNLRSFIYNEKNLLDNVSTSLVHKFHFNPYNTIRVIGYSETVPGEGGDVPKLTYSSENQIESLNSRNNRINYTAISEVSENGLIEKKFNVNPLSSSGSQPINPSVHNPTSANYNEWKEGQLKELNIYKREMNNYQPLKETVYSYQLLKELSFNNYNMVPTIIQPMSATEFINNVIYNSTTGGCTTLFCNVIGKIGIHFYNNYIYEFRLTKEEVVEYRNDSEIQTTTTYSYDNPNHLQLTAQAVTNSNGEKHTTKYQYPPDLIGTEQSPYMQDLTDDNRIAEPVITQTYFQKGSASEKTSEKHIKYTKNASTGNLILPIEVHTKKGSGSIDITSIEDRKITYTKYDTNGNILEYKLENGIPVSIIWGYNGQYPIAKVEGAPYSDIQSQAGALVTASNGGTLTETSFNSLRSALNASQRFAMLTCYIYEPLVGIKMIIQPNGQKEVYEYDNAGRLIQVKDHNNKVIKKIDYNYQH